MQAIQDVELACKFAERGCKYVGARVNLIEHINECPFDPKVECQFWNCKVMVSMEKMVNHLKESHKHLEISRDGKATMSYTKNKSIGNFFPTICHSKGDTFFIHAATEQDNWMLWVVLLGTKEDAQNYEIIMTVKDDLGLPLLEFTGKVFSIDKKKENIVLEEGVLHLDKEFAEIVASNNADGKLVLKVYYDIISK